MSQQQRVVQLSAASLAIIFGRDDESATLDGGRHSAPNSSGQEIFAEFKSQNLRSFWNKRLVKAVADVYFQGWLENSVLLVQGNANHLEVLREAWMRRALRSPKGLVIRVVGDLAPVQMSPISQSQFIPLSEVLCSVISDMNAAHVTVNLEALISHMMKSHPGMTIPTQDILYNALGALIKERKLYHTGEGYFIVTPQTYFITNNLVKDKSWRGSGESDPPSPPPITYLVSNDTCLEATVEMGIMAHCKSCSCFVTQSSVPPSVQELHSVSECTAKSLKRPREPRPSVQNQSTSTAADGQSSPVSRSTTASRKEKEKAGRKFGLSLFRRNTAKKENKATKKEYVTFSGQFPPEEWPVRDEEDLNNLPRDLEHAIIKRINPELTVDNLVRHTVLMKKLEERGAERVERGAGRGEKGAERVVDKGMSTELLLSRQRLHPSKPSGKKSLSKPSRSKKRGPSARERQRLKSKLPQNGENAEDEGEDLVPSRLRVEVVLDEPDIHEDSATVEGKGVFKRRIENPFQTVQARDPPLNTGHKEHRRREGKSQGSGLREKGGHRSKSWDPHRAKGFMEETEKSLMTRERSCDRLTLSTGLDLKPAKELPADYSSLYPDSCTLRMDEKIQQLRDRRARSRDTRESPDQDPKYSGLRDMPDQKYHTSQTHPSHAYKTAEIPLSCPKPCVQRGLSLRQIHAQDDLTHRPDLLSSHRYGNTVGSRAPADSRGQQRGPTQPEEELYTDEEQHMYAQVEDDGDGCSSLCLNEEGLTYISEISHPAGARCRQPVCVNGDWDAVLDGETQTAQQESVKTTEMQGAPRWRGGGGGNQLVLPHILPLGESSPRRETSVGGGDRLHKATLEETEPTEVLDSSIFDYCPTSEVDSDTETVQKSTFEEDGQSSHRVGTPHMMDCPQGQSECSEDAVVPLGSQGIPSAGETIENQSSTADSGIDSPRNRMSLGTGSSVFLRGLRQRGFLQDVEKLQAKSSSLSPQSSLLQLTPVMNV